MCDISRVFVVKENGEVEEKYFCVKCQTDLTGEAVDTLIYHLNEQCS